ncbi:MAG TPA: hypothetical protein VN920_12675, partial [Pyrinomonadaceae bacterium]|nr:hypothetical protein [Pyrinomonadaceae bacterium]
AQFLTNGSRFCRRTEQGAYVDEPVNFDFPQRRKDARYFQVKTESLLKAPWVPLRRCAYAGMI